MTKKHEEMPQNWPFGRLIRKELGEWEQHFVWFVLMGLSAILGIAVLLAGVAWLVGIWLMLQESWNAITATDAGTQSSEVRSSMLILAAVVGAPFVIWRAILAGRQVQINQEGHYTDLFTKAVEQLGATKAKYEDVERTDSEGRKFTQREQTTERNIEVRLGAIYALERVMADSKRDAGPIVETLAAYIRENCGNPKDIKALLAAMVTEFPNTNEFRKVLKQQVQELVRYEKPPGESEDVVAALNVLGRRPEHARWDQKLGREIIADLRKVNFQGADLSGFDFSKTDLSSSNFDGAILKEATFEGALLKQASFVATDCTAANFSRANLGFSVFEGADFHNGNLSSAEMSLTNFRACHLLSAEFSFAHLSWCNMESANLYGAVLKGANISCEIFAAKRLPKDFQDQLAQTFGIKGAVHFPKEYSEPAHWIEENELATLKDENDAWEAFKKTLGN